MRVGFFATNEPYVSMAKHLLESVRDVMPGVKVFQLGDMKSPLLEGIDGVVVPPAAYLPLERKRVLAQACCEGDWLFCDSDVTIQKDVRAVFDDPFDVAITNRDGTITTEGDYAKVMPYNMGVCFSRSPQFWLTVDLMIQQLPANFQNWEGEQRVIATIMKSDHHFDIAVLPGMAFNYPPKSSTDDLRHASIVHWKGNRKQWMQRAA